MMDDLKKAKIRPDFPRSVSYHPNNAENQPPILRHDVGIFWDLRRYHLGSEVTSVESIVVALKYREGLLREFCRDWFGLSGLNVLVKVAVVADLPSGASLEVQRQQIIRAFDDLQMQFCNVEGNVNTHEARREGVTRFVTQFCNDYPNPLLVVISDDLRLLQSVRHNAGSWPIIPIISRYKHGRSDLQIRYHYNRILASNVALHPWDVYFYETIMSVLTKSRRVPRNCLQILYLKRDTATSPGPLLAWLISLLLQATALTKLQQSTFAAPSAGQ